MLSPQPGRRILAKIAKAAGAFAKAVARSTIKTVTGTTLLAISCPRADEPKDQGEQSREDDRCHDREIDTDISFRTLVFDVTGRNDSPGRTVPFGFSFAIADLAVLMSPERAAQPGVALAILVSARRSRSASQSKRARASTTTMKILRNVYISQLAIVV